MNKLKSRKLWIALGSVISILIAEYFGVDVEPQAIAGLAVVASTYIVGQSLVDKGVGAEQVKVAGDVGRAQLELYARNLEAQLTEMMENVPEQGLASVDELPFEVGPPQE